LQDVARRPTVCDALFTYGLRASRLDWLTANEVGIFVDAMSAAVGASK
jgi:hypothetical protein